MRNRLPSLTSGRFFAALAIVGVHLTPLLRRGAVADVLSHGGVGVSFFFILSGFVMAWSARQGDGRRAFYRRRFARVWPLHAFTWVAAIAALATVLPAQQSRIGQALALPLMQAWIPDAEIYFAANGVAWTLSCEAFFYALFPFLLPVISRMRPPRRAFMIVTCVSIIVMTGALLDPTESTLQQWAGYVLPLARLPEFLIGMLLACSIRDGWRPPAGVAGAGAITGLALVLAVLVAPEGLSRVATTVVPFSLLIASLAVADLEGRPTGLRSRLLVRLGEWSFALYMSHQILFNIVGTTRVATPPWLLAVTSVAAAVALSGALHVLVERPAEERLRGQQRPAQLAP